MVLLGECPLDRRNKSFLVSQISSMFTEDKIQTSFQLRDIGKSQLCYVVEFLHLVQGALNLCRVQ